MKKLAFITLILCAPLLVVAHNSDDPVKDLIKNKSRLSSVQLEFDQLSSQNERFDNLQKQANYLQHNILILRRLMAADYPHVKSDMSKYKLDYIEEVDTGLQEFRKTLEQIKETISK